MRVKVRSTESTIIDNLVGFGGSASLDPPYIFTVAEVEDVDREAAIPPRKRKEDIKY